jgi:ketose-bisphosphate aldolase
VSGQEDGWTVEFRDAVADARQRRRPLLAFNIVDVSSLQGIVEAAARAHRPVIAQVSARTVRAYGAGTLRALVTSLRPAVPVRCYLHLDHCTDAQVLEAAIDARFDGMMIDASALDYRENLETTAGWARRGHAAGLVVEGELGQIVGAEDGMAGAVASGVQTAEACLTFAQETGVDLLGVDIGTAHGVYREAPRIRFDLVEAVAPALEGGMVVHGGTGLDDATLQRLASLAVAKINISTDLKLTWAGAVRGCLERPDSRVPEPLAALEAARRAVAEMAFAKMQVFSR